VARPREFDEQQVLDRALQAFWARGYDATSVEDLVEATGLGRASLYGAFGDKEQLFRRVVSHYLERSRAEKDRVTSHLSARKALEAFLLFRLAAATDNQQTAGCFLQMAATSGTSPPLVHEALESSNVEMNGWFLQHLREAQAEGELGPDADLTALTGFIGVFASGLTASAKAGLPLPALSAAAHAALDLIFKSPHAAAHRTA
jgi:TetR/AcrR family transcriptional regulator, transcriptional repressor for nem operon